MILTDKAKRNIETLKKHEGSNKAFAVVTGINAATTSKMSTASAISEKHLDRILKAYNLHMDEFFHSNIDNRLNTGCLAKVYYGYFLTTWDNAPVRMDSAVLEVLEDNLLTFKINLTHQPSKVFEGTCYIDDNYFHLDFTSVVPSHDYRVSIIMPWDNRISPPKTYYGGLGLLCLPSDGGTVPCVQKILLSNLSLNIDRSNPNGEYKFIYDCLTLNEGHNYIKIRKSDDYNVFLFLRNLNQNYLRRLINTNIAP